MSQLYTQRRRTAEPSAPAGKEPAPSSFSLYPAAPNQPGKPLRLAEAIHTKMEHAFGADLSAVRLYKNPLVGEADGSGFLRSAPLEAQADRERQPAAAGETVYDGPVAAPLSDASASAGPIQAKKYEDRELNEFAAAYGRSIAPPSEETEPAEDPLPEEIEPAEGPPPSEAPSAANLQAEEPDPTQTAVPDPMQTAVPDPTQTDQDPGPVLAGRPDAPSEEAASGIAPEEIAAIPQPDWVKDAPEAIGWTKAAKDTGTTLANSTSFFSTLAKAQNKPFFQVFGPTASFLTGNLGLAGGLTGLTAGTVNFFRNIGNLKAGTSGTDVLTSGLDTLSAGGCGAYGGLTTAKSLLGTLGKKAAAAVPGLAIATGGLSLLTGGIQAYRGNSALNTLKDKSRSLAGIPEDQRSENQKRLLQIFAQGQQVSERNRASGSLKALSGTLGAATGILALTGVGAIPGLLTGLAGGALGLTGFIHDRITNSKLRRDVTAEELGINWEQDMQSVRDWWSREHPESKMLRDKDIRAIILKNKGIAAGTRTAAYKQITRNRAADLLRIASQGSEEEAAMARDAIEAMGIKRRNGVFQKGALDLLAQKLS